MVPPYRYTALARFLDAEPRSAVRLSFATVEHVLGAPLPPSARNHRAWWGNQTGDRRVQANGWMAVGWRVSAVNRTSEQVTSCVPDGAAARSLADVTPHNRSVPSASVVPVLVYPDVRAAVAFLETAFGFEERVQIGEDHRSQLRFGDGALIVGDVRGDRRPPSAGHETHAVMVRVEDVRAHCEHARAHGATILMEPTDFEYGERQYSAEDPGGHRWTFTQTLRDTAPEEWGGIARNGAW